MVRLSGMGAAIAILSLIAIGCRPEKMDSVWLKTPSSQENPDWWNLTSYRLDEMNGTMTLANDSSLLFVRFVSREPHFNQRLERQGLMLWLSNPQDKTQRLGIHYPLGMRRGDPPFRGNRYLPDANVPPTEMNMLAVQNDEFEILWGDSVNSPPKSREEVEDLGIRVLLGETTEGNSEYTLRLRMGEILPWIKPGARIRMEVESTAPERPEISEREKIREEMKDRGGGGGRPGGRGGMGRPGGGSGGPPEEMKQQMGPIQFEFQIQLAEGPKSS